MRYFFALACLSISLAVWACTGITLKSEDGGVVVSRTVEWALGDALHNKLLIMPRDKKFVALTPEGNNGLEWKNKYGFVTVTAYDQKYGPDGLNEAGLYTGVYYHPGFAEYAVYDPALKAKSLSVGDLMQWILSSFSTVEEVRSSIEKVIVVDVKNEDFGGASLPFHFKVADPSGASIVIEIMNGGKFFVYDSFLGVIANSPTYDWHLTNMRNYLKLSPEPATSRNIGDYELSPLSGGSGAIGLPGDFTAPSRFIRAAYFTATARPLKTSKEAVLESFRILDNFNIPLGSIMPKEHLPENIVGSTQLTTSSDLKEKIFYYHTMWNRQIRMIDLKKIDFSKIKETIIDDDVSRENVIKDVTPR